jgi:hypothetical protein
MQLHRLDHHGLWIGKLIPPGAINAGNNGELRPVATSARLRTPMAPIEKMLSMPFHRK